MYPWIGEALVLVLCVLLFNFVVKWILLKLCSRFEEQGKIWHESFVKALYKPLSYYVWFFAATQALEIIDKYTLTELSLRQFQIVLGFGAIGALAWFLLRWKSNVFAHMLVKSKNREISLDITKIDVLDKLLTLVILFFTALLILEFTGSSLRTLIAFGGIGGLAIAFASQEMIANFFAGIMIYVTQPFAKGDWVDLPEKHVEGHVEEIGWYMTLIRNLDKRPIYVPNAMFSKVVVVNPTRMTHRRFKETIGLRYSDFPLLKEIIADITHMLQTHPKVDANQSISVNFSSFGNYSLDIEISVLVLVLDNPGFARLKGDLLFKIADIIEKHEAEMAYPTSVVNFKNDAPPRVIS